MLTVSLIWEKLFIQFHAISYPIPSLFLFAWCAPLLTRIPISELSRVCAVKRVDFPNRRDNSSAVTPPRKNSTRTHTCTRRWGHDGRNGGQTWAKSPSQRIASHRDEPPSAFTRVTSPASELPLDASRRLSHRARRVATTCKITAISVRANIRNESSHKPVQRQQSNNHNLKS